PAARLRTGLLATRRPSGPLEDERPHRVLSREHVRADAGRGERLPAQADELPVPHHDVQVAPAELPRPAAALRRTGDGLSLCTVGGPARPTARARLRAGPCP